MREEKYFVFPMNYNKRENFLGFIDYRALAIIGGISFIIFSILRCILISMKAKACIFITFISMPVILLLLGINGENIIDMIKYAFKFSIGDKVFVYRKDFSGGKHFEEI